MSENSPTYGMKDSLVNLVTERVSEHTRPPLKFNDMIYLNMNGRLNTGTYNF